MKELIRKIVNLFARAKKSQHKLVTRRNNIESDENVIIYDIDADRKVYGTMAMMKGGWNSIPKIFHPTIEGIDKFSIQIRCSYVATSEDLIQTMEAFSEFMRILPAELVEVYNTMVDVRGSIARTLLVSKYPSLGEKASVIEEIFWADNSVPECIFPIVHRLLSPAIKLDQYTLTPSGKVYRLDRELDNHEIAHLITRCVSEDSDWKELADHIVAADYATVAVLPSNGFSS